jgi:hypothetical protein
MNELFFTDPPQMEEVLKARRRTILKEAERDALRRANGRVPRRIVYHLLAGLGRYLVAAGEKLQERNTPAATLRPKQSSRPA